MTTEQPADAATDERFWEIVGAPLKQPTAPVGVRSSSGVGRLAIAACSAGIAVVIAIALFRLQFALGVLWLYLGAPALMLAALCPAEWALRGSRVERPGEGRPSALRRGRGTRRDRPDALT